MVNSMDLELRKCFSISYRQTRHEKDSEYGIRGFSSTKGVLLDLEIPVYDDINDREATRRFKKTRMGLNLHTQSKHDGVK